MQLLVLALICTAASAQTSLINNYFAFLRQSDVTLFGASSVGQDTTQVIRQTTSGYGLSNVGSGLPMYTDNMFRFNRLGELLVTAAVLRLIVSSQLPSLDSPLPVAYLPRGITLVNPSFPATSLTMRMLLTHTSSITDVNFDSFAATLPNTVADLSSFVQQYFLTSSGGTYSINAAVFSSSQPGLTTSYNPARANIALAAFIVQQVVIAQPILITSTSKTFLAYIQEVIINPLGMADTTFQLADGSFALTSYPANGAVSGTRRVQDLTASGAVTSNTQIHPAYPADYMGFTSCNDLGRLTRALFLDSKSDIYSIGQQMIASAVDVTAAALSPVILTAQKKQGLGVVYFDGPSMCSIALASSIITKCPLTAASNVWGHMSAGRYSLVGTFCTDAVSVTNPTCVTVSISHYQVVTTKSYNVLLGLAAVSFQQTIGVNTVVNTVSSPGSSSDSLYGLWVFFGVVGVIAFVLIASYFTEYVVQPAPPSAGIAVPTLIPPIKADTYAR